jgi:hypothetical protein
MRKLIRVAAGSLSLAVASTASAEILPGACTFSQACAYETIGNSTSITLGENNLAVNFSETVTFTNTLAGLYSATFGTSSAGVNLSDVYLQEVLGGGGFGTRYDFQTGTQSGNIEQYFLDGLQLAAGQYQFVAAGTRAGTDASAIAGTLTITNNNVPEPATWIMMLMGFGAAGYSVRRGRRSSNLLTQVA